MNYNNLAERSSFYAGSPQFKHVPFFITSISLPEISLDHPEISGGRFSHSIKLAGDTIRYGTLSLEMLVDEDLLIYDELYKLVINNTNPESNTFGDFSFEFFVEINDNKGNTSVVFDFFNCRISSLGALELETTDDHTNYRISVDIMFDSFKPRRVRHYNLLGEYDILRRRSAKDIVNEWIDSFDLDEFILWGLPLPEVIHNTLMEEVISMVHPEESEYESGIIRKEGFDPLKPFEIRAEFEVTNRTVRFGLTEGSGIRSSINGRTGKSLTKFAPEESGVYTIQWNPQGPEVNIIILKDDVEILNYQIEQTLHSEIFMYFQGKTSSNIKSIEYRM